MATEFVIVVKPNLFLSRIERDGTVIGIATPSRAWRFPTYERASSISGRLHHLGHRESVYIQRDGTADLQAKDPEGFLVALGDDYGYVRAMHEREINCVADTKAAKVFTQEAANTLAGKLRRRGFPRASVIKVSSGKANSNPSTAFTSNTNSGVFTHVYNPETRTIEDIR